MHGLWGVGSRHGFWEVGSGHGHHACVRDKGAARCRGIGVGMRSGAVAVTATVAVTVTVTWHAYRGIGMTTWATGMQTGCVCVKKAS
eukprot:350631-Chlamydomonas_euryale.AAC.16